VSRPELAILVPVLRRPQRVKPLLYSIERATPEPHRVYFIPDPDDTGEKLALSEADANVICELDGNYAQKINAAAQLCDENFLFLAADDLHFHPGWYQAASAKMRGGIGVVGTNDLGNGRVIAGEHSTHSLAARWYMELGTIDEPGKLLHEGYPHEFVDDEFVETAKRRGMYAHAGDSYVEHLHPLWSKAPTDELYDAHAPRMRAGRRIFRQRRPLWTT
jgi:glycosyltransferase involved in cell wall biosynthesis